MEKKDLFILILIIFFIGLIIVGIVSYISFSNQIEEINNDLVELNEEVDVLKTFFEKQVEINENNNVLWNLQLKSNDMMLNILGGE